MDESDIAHEEILIRQDDGSRIREELRARRRLRSGRVERQQDSTVGSLSKGSDRVELCDLRRGRGLRDGLARASDTRNIEVSWRGLRLDSECTVGSHHHEDLAAVVAIVGLEFAS